MHPLDEPLKLWARRALGHLQDLRKPPPDQGKPTADGIDLAALLPLTRDPSLRVAHEPLLPPSPQDRPDSSRLSHDSALGAAGAQRAQTELHSPSRRRPRSKSFSKALLEVVSRISTRSGSASSARSRTRAASTSSAPPPSPSPPATPDRGGWQAQRGRPKEAAPLYAWPSPYSLTLEEGAPHCGGLPGGSLLGSEVGQRQLVSFEEWPKAAASRPGGCPPRPSPASDGKPELLSRAISRFELGV